MASTEAQKKQDEQAKIKARVAQLSEMVLGSWQLAQEVRNFMSVRSDIESVASLSVHNVAIILFVTDSVAPEKAPQTSTDALKAIPYLPTFDANHEEFVTQRTRLINRFKLKFANYAAFNH
jgi:hypothetical protein